MGANLGVATSLDGDDRGTSFLVGAEASLIDLRAWGSGSLNWGMYLDSTYDTNLGLVRSSFGPEWIYLPGEVPIGLDLGPLVEWDREHLNLGGRVRLFLPVPLFTPYVGVTVLGSEERAIVGEAGLLLKYAIIID